MTRTSSLLRFPRRQRAQAQPTPKLWPALAAPVDAMETVLRARAQSALCGLRYRDGSTACDALTLDQARDVLAWYHPAN